MTEDQAPVTEPAIARVALSPAQLHWARVIVTQVTHFPRDLSTDERKRAADISLEIALTESSLRMLANRRVPASMLLPHEGVGSDHASLGLFQQQWPSWGTVSQLMSGPESTRRCLRALLRPGWTAGTNWEIAQRVQVSAFADGRNYRANDALAIATRRALWPRF